MHTFGSRRVGYAGIPWHMKREMCVKSRWTDSIIPWHMSWKTVNFYASCATVVASDFYLFLCKISKVNTMTRDTVWDAKVQRCCGTVVCTTSHRCIHAMCQASPDILCEVMGELHPPIVSRVMWCLAVMHRWDGRWDAMHRCELLPKLSRI